MINAVVPRRYSIRLHASRLRLHASIRLHSVMRRNWPMLQIPFIELNGRYNSIYTFQQRLKVYKQTQFRPVWLNMHNFRLCNYNQKHYIRCIFILSNLSRNSRVSICYRSTEKHLKTPILQTSTIHTSEIINIDRYPAI